MNKSYDNITGKAQALYNRYKTRDPFVIAKSIGITVLHSNDLNRIKGLYRVIKKNRFIILNAKNSVRTNNIVCAHEIGHDQLHRSFARDNTLKEFMLYDMSLKPEYEANLFAAELLLDDNDIMDCIKNEYDLHKCARELDSDTNLVAIKIDIMNRKGYNLNPQDRVWGFLK